MSRYLFIPLVPWRSVAEYDQKDVRAALQRARRKRNALTRETELFYMFFGGVVFGIISAALASFIDNSVRGVGSYPFWYAATLVAVFLLTLVVLFAFFVSLRKAGKDISLMEKNFESMLEDIKSS